LTWGGISRIPAKKAVVEIRKKEGGGGALWLAVLLGEREGAVYRGGKGGRGERGSKGAVRFFIGRGREKEGRKKRAGTPAEGRGREALVANLPLREKKRKEEKADVPLAY